MSVRQFDVGTIYNDETALKAFDKLRRYGADPVLLLVYLMMFHDVMVRQEAKRSEFSNLDDWAKASGMTIKTIRGLPERVRNLANEIERINRTEHINPLRLWARQASSRPSLIARRSRDDMMSEFLRDAIQSLPAVLTGYARLLEAITSRACDDIVPRWTHQQQISAAKERLIRAVKDATGRPFFANVAKLLTAVCRRATGRLDAEITTQSLVELHKAWQGKNLRIPLRQPRLKKS